MLTYTSRRNLFGKLSNDSSSANLTVGGGLRARDDSGFVSTVSIIDTNADDSGTFYCYTTTAGGGWTDEGTKGIDYGTMDYEIKS